MSAIQHIKNFSLGIVLSTSFIVKAAVPFPKAQFGVVKSKDGLVYMACDKSTEELKTCYIYQHKKDKEPEAISHEIKLLDLSQRSEAVKNVLQRKSHEEFNSFILFPLTALAAYQSFVAGPKYLPLFLLSPLDVVAGPVMLMADGCRRLYRLIQGTYLKKAWKTVTGQSKNGSMNLSRKDYKEFVEAIKRSAI